MLGVVGIKVESKRKFYLQHKAQSAHARKLHELSESDTKKWARAAPQVLLKASCW